MKILITSDWNTCAINGVVTSIQNLMYGLRARGHEVKILALSSDRETRITEDGWEVASLPANVVYPGARVRVGLMNKVYDKVIEWGPDIIHSQCEMSSFVMAHHIAHECDVPIVHTYHTVYEDYTHYVVRGNRFAANQRNKMAKQVVAEFSKIVSGLCDGMIAPTNKVKTLLEGYECKCPIYVVPSGITLDSLRRKLSDSERDELRKKYGIKDDEIIALFLGRIAAEKNIDEVMRYITSSDNNVRLLVAGGGPKLDSLLKYAEDNNMTEKVSFAGMVDPKEVWKYYQLGDFFTSASTSETQGLTYIEALSTGLPLLCRKDPCLDDVVEEGENGWLFENESEFMAGMKNVISLISGENYNRKTIGETADKFSRECFASSVEKIYLDTIAAYKRKPESAKENVRVLLTRINELTRENWKKVSEPIKKVSGPIKKVSEPVLKRIRNTEEEHYEYYLLDEDENKYDQY